MTSGREKKSAETASGGIRSDSPGPGGTSLSGCGCLHVAVLGRPGSGKTSLLEALSGGRLGAPVHAGPAQLRQAELAPFGATVFLESRWPVGGEGGPASSPALERADLALVLVDPSCGFGDDEEALLMALEAKRLPVVCALTKSRVLPPKEQLLEFLLARGLPAVAVDSSSGEGVDLLRERLLEAVPEEYTEAPLLRDLVQPGDLVVLVISVDPGRQWGRFVLPKAQALRDVLNAGASAVCCRAENLPGLLDQLPREPSLVVADGAAFAAAHEKLPGHVPLTSFPLLLARNRGDLTLYVEGCRAVETLRPGDNVLMAEACANHWEREECDSIHLAGWLSEKAGGEIRVETVASRRLPDELTAFELVVHCGACAITRGQTLARLARCRQGGVPVTCTGVLAARMQGLLERGLAPFNSTR